MNGSPGSPAHGRPTRVLTPYLIAGWLVVIGVPMIVAGDGSYTAGGYAVAFDMMPRQAWGVAFVAAALLWMVVGRSWAFVPMAVLLPTWALAMYAAVLEGRAGSPTSGAWPGLAATVLLVTAAQRGIERRY